jgi:hypothetical protein
VSALHCEEKILKCPEVEVNFQRRVAAVSERGMTCAKYQALEAT